MTKITRTKEGLLTSAIKEYCTKKNIPCISDVNGTHVKGWSHIPDAIIGTEKDDIYTKCVIIEIKPTRDAALKDLQKEEYRRVKYLAAVYFNGNQMVGQKASWLKPDSSVGFELVGPEVPLERLLNSLYATYKRTTNPAKDQIVDRVNALLEQKQYKAREIFGVLSNCFCDNPRPENLPYSLGQLWDMCSQVSGNSSDEIEVLHNIIFREQTRSKRYELGQFITEYPWTLKIAELVVEEFDKRKDFTLYEPCVGTGAITCEVITLLYRKYGKMKAKKIVENQLIVADIDPKMRAFAHVVLWNHTESLFGSGIDVKIQTSDLTTDDFDLSKMIVFGNYPFNAGNDYNYLAKILRKQLDCGLSHMVLMGNTTTFDKNRVQSRKILGDDFYNWIEEKEVITDFQEVAVKISIVVLDKTRSVVQHVQTATKFTTLRALGCEFKRLEDVIPIKFNDGTSFLKAYTVKHSVPYFRGKDLKPDAVPLRIPTSGSPGNSIEAESLNRWHAENPTKKIREPYDIPGAGAILVNKLSSTTTFTYRYITIGAFPQVAGNHMVLKITAPEKGLLSILGLILSHPGKLLQQIAVPHYTGWGLRSRMLENLPFPKETEENKASFDRLREIGQTLIIEGKEDEVLRKEADEIIEKLYNV